ncbi:MAG: TolC family protein [Candidatus Aminicenantes bacterium]|nr:TolC family protein [Candidatus Aminicenantes bacterium]
MIRKTTIAAVLAVLIFASTAASQERPAMNLTLEEAIAKALKNNLNVAVEMFTPELAGHSLDRAREAFLPSLKMTYGNNRNENPSYWWLSGSGTNIDRMANYAVSVVEAIPTGGSFSLSLQNYRSETNQAFQLINPRYGSTLQMDFTQPLLKNFGPKVARRQITQAQAGVEIADSQLRNTMIETVYLVQEGYWNLVFAVESFKVKEKSLQLGKDLLAKNRKEVEFGQLAPLEILNAEAAVAQREADLIQAEFLITRSEEVLKSMLNLAVEGGGQKFRLVPTDRPAAAAEAKPSLDSALAAAREKRPDLAILRKTIETKELAMAVARNQMLPGLDLTLSYWSPGISGDRLLYDGNDFFGGTVIGKVPGQASDALRDAFKMLYSNWNVGLTLTVPLSTFMTRAELTYARADLSQSQVRLQASEQQAELEISDAVRSIEANAKRAEAYKLARELAEKSLEAEVKKLAVGLSTNYFVLDYQEKLANAQSLELKSKIDYVLSVERLEKAAGINLEKRSFKIGG